jgi:WD40 repeat protein
MKHYYPLLVVCLGLFACNGEKQQQQQGQQSPARPPKMQVWVETVALSPDGKLALFGYKTGVDPRETFNEWVKVWDVERGAPLCTLQGFTRSPSFLAFLPDSKTAVAADWGGLLRFYAIPSGRLLRSMHLSSESVGTIVLSDDGKLALARDGKIWDLVGDKEVQRFPDWQRANHEPYAISPDHHIAVALDQRGDLSGKLVVYDIATGKILKELPISEGWGGPVTFAADSKRALVCKHNLKVWQKGYLVLCELETGKEIWASEEGLLGGGGGGRFLPGERHVLVKGAEAKWSTLDAATGKVVNSFTTEFGTLIDGTQVLGNIANWQLSKDSREYLAVAGSNPGISEGQAGNLTVKVWHLGKNAELVKTWADTTTTSRAK